MTLQELQTHLLTAMKVQQAAQVQTLRMVIAAAKNKQIDKGGELTEEEITAVIKKQVKETQESLAMYQAAGKMEEVAPLEVTLKQLTDLLPPEMSDEALDAEVGQCVQNFCKTPGADMKKIIPHVMQHMKGKASGQRIMPLIQKHVQRHMA